ncbi:hypothetical protein SPI_02740 [Niveomyces insectorum RCEF 264]|uniref:Uncharacterized protein n=1 Tax=Niveomyces insectorum RCEF 264 TaxID=1081102 RepID=A0A167Y7W4_9HYPO|nr:hypothetical protein SPI_02740 [Niveomyces insectorum RCEF 264]
MLRQRRQGRSSNHHRSLPPGAIDAQTRTTTTTKTTTKTTRRVHTAAPLQTTQPTAMDPEPTSEWPLLDGYESDRDNEGAADADAHADEDVADIWGRPSRPSSPAGAAGAAGAAAPSAAAAAAAASTSATPGPAASWTGRNRWVALALASGTCAAINGVFAKLTTTEATSHWANSLAKLIGLDAVERVVDVGVRGMWALFTKALAAGHSAVQVAVMNTSSNFVLTALLGSALFAEALPPLWWLGTALLVAGNVIVGRQDGGSGAKGGDDGGVAGEDDSGTAAATAAGAAAAAVVPTATSNSLLATPMPATDNRRGSKRKAAAGRTATRTGAGASASTSAAVAASASSTSVHSLATLAPADEKDDSDEESDGANDAFDGWYHDDNSDDDDEAVHRGRG